MAHCLFCFKDLFLSYLSFFGLSCNCSVKSFYPVFSWSVLLSFPDITDKAVVSHTSAPNQSQFDTKSAKLSVDKVVSTMEINQVSSQSDLALMGSPRTKSGSVENLGVCPLVEQHCGRTVLRKTSFSNQNLNLECQENLPPPRALSSEVLLPVPEKPASPTAPPAVGNHSARAGLRLDLSAPHCDGLERTSLKTLSSRVKLIDSPCRQALVSPTEMRSLGKDSRKRISNIEKNLTPKASNRLSSAAKSSPALKKSAGNPQSTALSMSQSTALSMSRSTAPTSAEANPTLSGIVFFLWS